MKKASAILSSTIFSQFAMLLGLTCGLVCMALQPKAQAASTPVIASVSPQVVGMVDHLNVTLSGLDGTGLDPASFRLRLNEHTFANIIPDRTAPNEISFDLSSLRKDSDGWLYLAGSPPYTGVKTVLLDLSTAGAVLHDANGKPVQLSLKIFNVWLLILAALLFSLIMTGFLALAKTQTMLRDTGGGLTAKSTPPAPYSLARCQMAFWFVLILASFLGLWVVTGDFNNIVSAQSLTLLGISSVTALGAVAIDSSKAAASQSAAATLAPGTSTAVEGQVEDRSCPKHLSFWKDILTDDTGWAFHRVQVVVWTLILGVVSLWSAYCKLALPTFDSNLLILMGISSGLYLGLKYPEQQTGKALPGDQVAPRTSPVNQVDAPVEQSSAPPSSDRPTAGALA